MFYWKPGTFRLQCAFNTTEPAGLLNYNSVLIYLKALIAQRSVQDRLPNDFSLYVPVTGDPRDGQR